MHVLAAPDKFKGTATSTEVAHAIVRAARGLGIEASAVALSDGGDGLLEVFGGPNRVTSVTGPGGDDVDAGWRIDDDVAVIESALASGLVLAGGASGNDAVVATSRGTGELIEAAVTAGARRIVVGLGGSACTDGGLGALDALSSPTIAAIGTSAVELVVCCDVRTPYLDAAVVYGPQKGASAEQIEDLSDRLATARDTLRARFDVDVTRLVGGGAAGGLAGGLAAVGGRLRPGFEVVAERVGFGRLLDAATLVVTGEGLLDETSFDGKVVGAVATCAHQRGVPVLAVVGDVATGYAPALEVVSLVERFGRPAAIGGVLICVEDATVELLSRRRWA
ncbi:MAG: glycerate kinase [Jatrophihabitans sp.]